MGKAARAKVKAAKPVKKVAKKAPATREMVDVENVNHPGKTTRVDAQKYKLARAAMLKFLPKRGPGLTQSEMAKAMREALTLSDFPGSTPSWWMKCVQLDLEAKGLVKRDSGKPLRWTKA